jgi:DNA-binding transcriptional regulator YdaS (Cro superfamily)
MVSLGYDVKSDAQIRQWRHGYSGRIPSPENCVGLELATNNQVTRRDLRPDDWQLIWPELREGEHA